jgi:hypothetical protein
MRWTATLPIQLLLSLITRCWVLGENCSIHLRYLQAPSHAVLTLHYIVSDFYFFLALYLFCSELSSGMYCRVNHSASCDWYY